jgi:putative MATE family efflux protein
VIPRSLRRSPHDRTILLLALQAVGTLAAQPLYVLVDTAIVGHLGRPQLAALGIAGVVLSTLFALFNFLTYATTAHVGRADGAGDRSLADRLGAQAYWLALAIGLGAAVGVAAFAGPIVALMGGTGRAAGFAETYLRIAALGLPFAFVALSGHGYLRGLSRLRTPLAIVVVANVVNVFLEVLFVYGFGWGIAGSAWGTVIAQAGMGVAFTLAVLGPGQAARRLEPALLGRLLKIGRHIFVRTAALYGSLAVASAAIVRFGDAAIGAHQVAFQLWVFVALLLDAVAVAGQVVVSRLLGAGEVGAVTAASERMVALTVALGTAFAAGMLALVGVLPAIFTEDATVLAAAREIWPLFALALPLSAAVYALDGILIGAGDARYLMWSMLLSAAVCLAGVAAAVVFDWGLTGVWAALVLLNAARLATLVARFRGRRWLVAGYA